MDGILLHHSAAGACVRRGLHETYRRTLLQKHDVGLMASEQGVPFSSHRSDWVGVSCQLSSPRRPCESSAGYRSHRFLGFKSAYRIFKRFSNAGARSTPVVSSSSDRGEGEKSSEQDNPESPANQDDKRSLQVLDEDQPQIPRNIQSTTDFLRPWPVPWGLKETSLGMILWIVSFIGSGLVVQLLAYAAGWTPWRSGDQDQQALFLLLNQAVRTALGIGVVWAVTRPYEPLNADFFSFDFKKPFSLERGWLLWAGVGFLSACVLVELSSLAQTSLQGVEPPRDEGDALLQVLPIIAASPFSTGSLILVAGVFAPFLEETIFRGFLMTSLTKWMPLPLAALLSAGAFAGAHLTPSEFPKLTALGLVLGLTYGKTRNLLAPMLIHSLWNSGIIILLTLLRLEGFDIQEMIQ